MEDKAKNKRRDTKRDRDGWWAERRQARRAKAVTQGRFPDRKAAKAFRF